MVDEREKTKDSFVLPATGFYLPFTCFLNNMGGYWIYTISCDNF